VRLFSTFLILVSFFVFEAKGQSDIDPIVQIADTSSAPATASIADLSWISGYWMGEALGGNVEEMWSDTLAGSMFGSFRLVVNNEVRFYELMTLTEEKGTVVLRIKHFNPDLKSWEENNVAEVFTLVEVTDSCAYFDGLTFEKVDADALTIHVLFIKKDGDRRVIPFMYRRKQVKG
jgi:hypothetical protein